MDRDLTEEECALDNAIAEDRTARAKKDAVFLADAIDAYIKGGCGRKALEERLTKLFLGEN